MLLFIYETKSALMQLQRYGVYYTKHNVGFSVNFQPNAEKLHEL